MIMGRYSYLLWGLSRNDLGCRLSVAARSRWQRRRQGQTLDAENDLASRGTGLSRPSVCARISRDEYTDYTLVGPDAVSDLRRVRSMRKRSVAWI